MQTRDEIIGWVQTRIDELAKPTQQSPVAPPAMIAKELNEAAPQVMRNARVQLIFPAATWLLDKCLVKADASGAPLSVIVPLPINFIRFLRVKVSGWLRSTDEIVDTNANTYRQMFNRFQTGSPDMPIAAIVPFFWQYISPADPLITIEYKQALEVFPAPANVLQAPLQGVGYQEDTALTPLATYSASGMKVFKNTGLASGRVPVVDECLIVERQDLPALGADDIPWPDSLVDPIVWLSASRVLANLRETALSKAALENYAISLGQLKVGMKGEEVKQVEK